jgi:hypothetical protein
VETEYDWHCKFGNGKQDFRTCPMLYIHIKGYYPTDELYQHALKTLCPNMQEPDSREKHCTKGYDNPDDCGHYNKSCKVCGCWKSEQPTPTMPLRTTSEEIQEWVDRYGSERDALNVALAKLDLAERNMEQMEAHIRAMAEEGR